MCGKHIMRRRSCTDGQYDPGGYCVFLGARIPRSICQTPPYLLYLKSRLPRPTLFYWVCLTFSQPKFVNMRPKLTSQMQASPECGYFMSLSSYRHRQHVRSPSLGLFESNLDSSVPWKNTRHNTLANIDVYGTHKR